jgi:serine/threonine protein kinase
VSELPVPASSSVVPSPEGPVRYGRYILIDRLGAGGMAEVFRALTVGAEQFQSLVVVKRILSHLCANPAFVKMFIDEAKLCGQLSHPNVIRVHDFGKVEGQYFIAMEYVQGRNLGPIIRRLAERRERMPPLIAAEIIRQAARGLAYAHHMTASDGKPLGIIHRDISPGNVMVAHTGEVKVLDFGVARVENRFRKTTTDPGQLKGKAGYLSPEQIASSGFDHRADIFPMGILLHEMLTGRRLFRGVSATESMSMIKSMPIPAPSQFNPDVPPALDAIVERALQRSPDARYQSAAALADDLESLLLEGRFSSHELPRFMQTFFQEDSLGERLDLSREDIQELIRRADKSGAHAIAAADAPRVGAAAKADSPSELSMLEQWPAPDLDTPEPEPVRRKPVLLVAGAIVAVSAALGLTMLLRPGRHGRNVAAAPIAAAPPALAAAAAAKAAVTPAEAPAPRAATTVTISISSDPTGAMVSQPGSPTILGVTPIELSFARAPVGLTFRVAKPGYVEGLLKVVPDTDKPVLVTLAMNNPAPSPASTPTAAPAARGSSHNGKKVRNALPMDPFSK